MKLQVNHANETVRIVVSGEIDEIGAAQLKESFEGINTDGVKTLAVDFRDVTHIGSAGLGKLLLFYKRLATANVNMRVENTPGNIRDLLKELKLDTLFTVC